jgi:hypothetical protein
MLCTMLGASQPNPLCMTIIFLKLRISHKISNHGWGISSAHQFHLIVRLPVIIFLLIWQLRNMSLVTEVLSSSTQDYGPNMQVIHILESSMTNPY